MGSLPTDDTPSFGGNYGLDGFQFYDDYNEGVEQSARLPGAQPHARLPDGMVEAEFDGSPNVGEGDPLNEIMFGTPKQEQQDVTFDGGVPHDNVGDLGVYMKEGNTISGPVDFSWLEGEQDPQRLPETPTDKALAGIMESWGERTNGKTISPIHRPEYTDLESAQFQASLENDAPAKPKLRPDELANIVQGAMRKSASGVDPKTIVKGIKDRLHDDRPSFERVRVALEKMDSEHGLAGKVFIRAMAYPGCQNGRWKTEVKKHASSSRYVVAGDKCKGCIHNKSASCSVFSKRIVKKIPWAKAFTEYARTLQASGIHVASTGNPEDDLRNAFGAKPVKQSRLTDERPVHVPIERVSEKAALDALARQTGPKVSKVQADTSGIIDEVTKQVQRWHSAGLFSDKQAHALLQIPDADKMLETATELATKAARAKKQEYTGAKFEHAQVAKSGPTVTPQDIDQVLRWAAQRMSEGSLGADLDRRLKQRFPDRILAASHDKLKLVRRKHEGLSGFAYIHAAAYASGKRDEGCAKGAAKLRTRGPRLVLAMDRCKGCIRNHAGTCSRYNKRLAKKPPVQDKAAYQAEQLRKASQRDARMVYDRGGSRVASSSAETAAALETNPVEEFNLFASTNAMTDIEFNGPSQAPLDDSDILFDDNGTGGITF